MYVCMYVWVYACMYVCVYACMYVYSAWSDCVHAPSWLQPASKFPVRLMTIFSSFAYVEESTTIKTDKSGLYRAFSLTRPASMLIYWRKRKCLHKERIQLPKDFLDTPTWPPFHCFETSTWPPWRHVKRSKFQVHRNEVAFRITWKLG